MGPPDRRFVGTARRKYLEISTLADISANANMDAF
jgi:hypothetical protein